jgi:hypothetical protein
VFLHGKLDDVDIYINPPAHYPCPFGMVLKLLKAIYGLIQAPVKFKQEVIDWFKGNGYLAANDAQTIWIKRDKMGVIIHALYADDFLHFTNHKVLYQEFQKQFKKRFDVKTGSVGVYLGNHDKILVDQPKLTVDLNQTEYVQELLERFNMTFCPPVSTPMVQRLSVLNSGENFVLKIRLCTAIWWVVSYIWLAGLVPTFLLLFQNFPGLCQLLVRITCRRSSTCSGISRAPLNWACTILSPRTVVLWTVQMFCGVLLTQIGLGVQIAEDPPQDML